MKDKREGKPHIATDTPIGALSVSLPFWRRIMPIATSLAVIGLLLVIVPAIGKFIQQADAAAPTITGVSPAKGPTSGGNTITISGSNFYAGLAFKSIAQGPIAHHACGIAMDDTLWCWGNNENGQLGNNSTAQRNIPTRVQGVFATASSSQVAVGLSHTCARLASNNQLYCWGYNNQGQLGDNSATQRNIPTAVASPIGTAAVAEVSAGSAHTCARLASNNQLYCWGG